jgi:hypothetical protein
MPPSSTNPPLPTPYIVSTGDIILQPDKPPRSKKKHIIIIAIILCLIITAAIIFLVFLAKGIKVGQAANPGPGEIFLATTKENGDKTSYRIQTDGALYRLFTNNFDYSSATVYTMPPSCRRVIYFALDEDMAACDQDSENPESFGSNFYFQIRYSLSDMFSTEDYLQTVFLKYIVQSQDRVFLELSHTESDGAHDMLVEYKDTELSQIITLDPEEKILWAAVKEGQS